MTEDFIKLCVMEYKCVLAKYYLTAAQKNSYPSINVLIEKQTRDRLHSDISNFSNSNEEFMLMIKEFDSEIDNINSEILSSVER